LLFAATLDANVIGSLGDDVLDLGEPAQLRAADWFARATVALRSADQVMVPVDADHRVFLLRSLQDRSIREVAWRACVESSDQVAQSRAIVSVMTVFDLQNQDVSRDEVTDMLGLLRKIDASR
jgi:hypothetical protein